VLPNDLLRRELFSSWHLVPSLGLHHLEILSLKVASFKGGRSPDGYGSWAEYMEEMSELAIEEAKKAR